MSTPATPTNRSRSSPRPEGARAAPSTPGDNKQPVRTVRTEKGECVTNIYYDFNAVLSACLTEINNDVKAIGGANIDACDAIPNIIKDVVSSVIGDTDPNTYRFNRKERRRIVVLG